MSMVNVVYALLIWRGEMIGVLFMWGIAAFFAWTSYSELFGMKSRWHRVVNEIAYRRGIGSVVEKLVIEGQYGLKFTYPEESNLYQGALKVSQKKFDKARIGDKILIYYGLYFPHLWMPVRTRMAYFASILALVMAVIFFLLGVLLILHAIFEPGVPTTP